MEEIPDPESTHERRVTWSLIGVVFAFVLLMTCIVLWITTSLIRNQGGSTSPPSPSNPPASVTPTPQPTTPTTAPTKLIETNDSPFLVDATWTPASGSHYVKFLYWYVKPNKVQAGECLQLTWVTEYAVSLKLYRNDELILDDAPPSSTLQDCPKRVGYAVYRLEAKNSVGQTNWIQLQVKVLEAP